MNLHGIAAPLIGTVNPFVPVAVRLSTGYAVDPQTLRQVPTYGTPLAVTGSISGTVLTVSAVSAGKVGLLQAIAGAGVAPGTLVTSFISGDGGPGEYGVSLAQDVPGPVEMTGSLTLTAQVQPLSTQDLMHLDGLNVQGSSKAIYFPFRDIDAVVRFARKGGDVVTLPDGTVWLTTTVLEEWPDWSKVSVTLQNEG